MASQSGQAAPPAKRGQKRGSGEEGALKFNVGHLVEKYDFLNAEQLAIDRDQQHGQVREVNEQNVLDLVHGFEANEPDELQLTVVLDRGTSLQRVWCGCVAWLLLCCPVAC